MEEIKKEALRKNVEGLFRLEDFMISPTHGFLFTDEILPGSLWYLESAKRKIPEYFGTKKLRRWVATLPEPLQKELDSLTKKQQHRAFKRYCFIASAYVHNHNEPHVTSLPKNIARPFWYLSKKIGKPPISSYCHYCQGNWILKDQEGPFEVENLIMEQTFVNPKRIPDEPGFVLVHTVIEYRGAPIPRIAGPCKQAMLEKNSLAVESYLWQTAAAEQAMYGALVTMPLWCDPAVYYLDVRPQIQPFNKIRFEGVTDPVYGDYSDTLLRGETGAQTNLIATLNALLGIKPRETPLTHHTRDMRNYMLPEHRSFIELVEDAPNLREYVLQEWRNHPPLRIAYNECLWDLYCFRKKHFEFAIEYIKKPGEGPTGTGGTPFEQWLADLRDETLDALVLVDPDERMWWQERAYRM